MKLSIRPATAADLPAMMTLEKRAVTAAHWSAEQYGGLFSASDPGRIALVVNEESELQGFLVARTIGKEWEIENIAVGGSARRRGMGTRLLGEFLDMARARDVVSVCLEVRESNHAARALYEKWAFHEIGRRRHYYQGPDEDAVLYRIDFIPLHQ